MDQGSGLQCLTWRFLSHPPGGQSTQLLINERKQLVGSLGLASFNGFENARHVTHVWNSTPIQRHLDTKKKLFPRTARAIFTSSEELTYRSHPNSEASSNRPQVSRRCPGT